MKLKVAKINSFARCYLKKKGKKKENVKSQFMSSLKNCDYETRKHDAILKTSYRKTVIVSYKTSNNSKYIYIYYTYYNNNIL